MRRPSCRTVAAAAVAATLLLTAPAAATGTVHLRGTAYEFNNADVRLGGRDDPGGRAPEPAHDGEAHGTYDLVSPTGEGHAVHRRRGLSHDPLQTFTTAGEDLEARELPDADRRDLQRARGAARRPARRRRRPARCAIVSTFSTRNVRDLGFASSPPTARTARGRDRLRDARAAGADLLQRARHPGPLAGALLERRRRDLDRACPPASTRSARSTRRRASRPSWRPAARADRQREPALGPARVRAGNPAAVAARGRYSGRRRPAPLRAHEAAEGARSCGAAPAGAARSGADAARRRARRSTSARARRAARAARRRPDALRRVPAHAFDGTLVRWAVRRGGAARDDALRAAGRRRGASGLLSGRRPPSGTLCARGNRDRAGTPLAMRTASTSDVWWKNAVVYCLDVETFADADSDGGRRPDGARRPDRPRASLGATCVWLMPLYPTPNRDDGYDITDYLGVIPGSGTWATSSRRSATPGPGLRVLPTSSSTTPRTSTRGSARRARTAARRTATSTSGPTTRAARRERRRRTGPGPTRPASATCTSSRPSSPT